MNYQKIDGAFAIVLVLGAFSGILLVQSFSMPPTPALMPRLVSIVVLVLSCAYLGSRLFFSRDQRDPVQEEGRKKGREKGDVSALAFVILMLGYWLFAYIIGLLPSTFFYMLLLPPLMGFRKWRFTAILAAVTTLVLFGCFKWILQIPFPRGILF